MSRRIYFSLGLLSASMIAFQLVLMQLISAVQWSYFAYMVISIALLGYGASGTLLAMIRSWIEKHGNKLLSPLMTISGLAMLGILWFSSVIFKRFDTYLIFVDTTHIVYLIIVCVSFFMPFFIGALAIGIIYINYVSRIGFLYFADLFGSGVGGIFLLALLWVCFPSQLPAVIAMLPLIAGMLIVPKKWFRILVFPSLIVLLIPIYLVCVPIQLPVSEFKSISKTLNLPESEIYLERKSPYGHIQLVRSPVLRYAPGLSLSFEAEVPVVDMLFCNGNWVGPIIGLSQFDTTHFLDFTTHAMSYRISTPENVLILEGGTALFAGYALWKGSGNIVLVEENKEITDLLKNELAGQSDSLLVHPYVRAVNLHARHFLLTDTNQYDLIILPEIESFGGTSGVNALKEQYVFTTDALADCWERLSGNGMIEVTAWLDYPARNPLRILASLVEMLEEKGVTSIESHLVALRSWGTISFLLKKTPFTQEEVFALHEFCSQMYFDAVLLPHTQINDIEVFNHLEDTTFASSVRQIISAQREEFYAAYDFNIRPVRDMRPYFSQFLKLNRLHKLRDTLGNTNLPFFEVGYFIVLLTFIVAVVIAIVLIVLPLFFIRWQGHGKLFTLLYFSGIGIGFMFVEVVLIQQFILYFGHPVFAASAVLTALLLSSGIGSLRSSVLIKSYGQLWKLLSLIFLIVLLYAIILMPLLRITISLSFVWKILFSIVLIFPLAFFMGMPFPIGLRLLSEHNKVMIPWAWGINGCFSVISTVLAAIIAVEAGYFWVMLAACIAYSLAVAAVLIGRLVRV
ncbi:MAG: hypothetical protein WCR58_09010 [Bacteroidales bacterium]|nr:hypothetical protein [Bacteroidales bacterium]MDD3701421.1 hypothetical protein [Bacteroidales bacterium]MDY0369504.1 hypothetical protein [Bacteroidales bacterium]